MALNFGIGVSIFRELRTENCYYIDKTGFIEELLTNKSDKVMLITRPRRFGKTLTMQMLKEFFDVESKDKENIFEGLAISKNKELCREWQNQYPVVYLTLKDCIGMTFESILHRFSDTIDPIVRDFGFLLKSPLVDNDDKVSLKKLRKCLDKELLANSLRVLIQSLYTHYTKQVILIIDEYDVPINEVHDTEYYPEMIKFIRTLLGSVLKDSPYLKFAVLTGCLRIARESIFTGLNNFKCYGISDKKFSNAIGFTSEEVDALLMDAELSYKKQEIKEWYDGYNFGDCTEIYCPWDVLQYVQDHQYDPQCRAISYWKNTSSNDIVRNFVDNAGEKTIQQLQTLMNWGCIEVQLIEQITYEAITSKEENLWTMLYLTGYLTKANEEQKLKCGKTLVDEKNTLLVIPNKEVWEIYDADIFSWFADGASKDAREPFYKAFWEGDAGKVTQILSDLLLNTISYHDYKEDFYHAFLLALFALSKYSAVSNREQGMGRSDIFLTDGRHQRAAIIEIKYTKEADKVVPLVKEGMQQIIDNKYDTPLRHYSHVFLWSICFIDKECLANVRKKENKRIFEKIQW